MKQLFALMISCVLFSATAFGHGGSHAPVPPEVAKQVAGNVAQQFTQQDPGLGFGKLPDNWSALPQDQISIFKQGKGYYIVEVKNAAEEKSLYVLMAISGEVYDANFTGEFKGLK